MKKRYPLGPKVRVVVSTETITRGTVADSRICMIAEALKEAVPVATHVSVDVATTRFTDPTKGLRYVYLTPFTAQMALLAFDEGRVPTAFSFTLRNAHVSAAGVPKPKDSDSAERKKAKEKALAQAAAIPSRSVIVSQHGTTANQASPRVIGGKRPPQLRSLRRFGLRQFAGASDARKAQLDKQQQQVTVAEDDGR
jgi:hypothetical protein